jgi:hypothetical protein
MGLKTTNYEVKELGITLPVAYAYIKKLYIDGTQGVAEFAIQSTRETVQVLSPIKTIRFGFTVNRNENPYVTAYQKAKGQRETLQLNEEAHRMEKVLVGEVFYGWQDDIVVGDYVENYI